MLLYNGKRQLSSLEMSAPSGLFGVVPMPARDVASVICVTCARQLNVESADFFELELFKCDVFVAASASHALEEATSNFFVWTDNCNLTSSSSSSSSLEVQELLNWWI